MPEKKGIIVHDSPSHIPGKAGAILHTFHGFNAFNKNTGNQESIQHRLSGLPAVFTTGRHSRCGK
jgi:hypothetical protein